MNMQYVNSTNLVAVGYDESTMLLRIRFHNGTYDYYNVPSHIYHGLMNASSKGRYHATYIKDAYPYRRIV